MIGSALACLFVWVLEDDGVMVLCPKKYVYVCVCVCVYISVCIGVGVQLQL